MKRKREDDVPETAEPLSVKQKRIQLKLKTEVAKVRHAFKVAKGFERQKLAKRRKDAVSGKGEKGLGRIDTEIEASKALDIDICAEHQFYKTLCKIKAVPGHPDVPPNLQEFVKLPSDSATLDVNARLCNSSPVRQALDGAISNIQSALGIKANDRKALKKKRQSSKDVDEETFALKGAAPSKASRAAAQKALSGEMPTRLTADDLNQSDVDSDADDQLEEFDDRIAASSDEDRDEDVDVDQLEQQLAMEGIRAKPGKADTETYDVRADLSLSDAASESRSVSPEPRKAPVVKKSSFIPLLTMGGYISGSGSEIDDLDVAPKKNRRGQRARQQIWEQKYGEKAKHLKAPDRNAGWDAKKGAVDGRGRGKRRSDGRGARRASPEYSVGANNEFRDRLKAKEQKQRDLDSKPLHPSWAAAKKAKEKKEAPVAFQGKKITFD